MKYFTRQTTEKTTPMVLLKLLKLGVSFLVDRIAHKVTSGDGSYHYQYLWEITVKIEHRHILTDLIVSFGESA